MLFETFINASQLLGDQVYWEGSSD